MRFKPETKGLSVTVSNIHWEIILRLYVESKKVELVEYVIPYTDTEVALHHGGMYVCRSKGNAKSLSAEDNEAIEYLKGKKLSFSLVDLSECSFKVKLTARISGIIKTPVLVCENGSRLKGIEEIRTYF